MKQHWFVRGDIDGFFGLFIDNVLQLMLINVLCRFVCGFPDALIAGRILPGAALSILIGNLFYAWQARQLAEKSGRTDVTALPYGINTVSLIAYIFFIMNPVYQATHDVTLTWRVGLFACLIGSLLEIAGAFLGDFLRKHTPRAALLSALAGIAITFISVGFVFQIFAAPMIALVPMMLILICYASGVKLPLGIPGGLFAVGVGVLVAWILKLAGVETGFHPTGESLSIQFHPPIPVFGDAFALVTDFGMWKYMSVIFPMALFNVVGSLQNLESAEAAGDRYETRPSLLANGLGSLLAALLGSPFPTTIYIGHPGWKAMGARAGYSIINGVAITALCLLGGVGWVVQWVPIETTLGILLWIGIIITAQSFQETPRKHALGVAMGLVPALAAWGLFLIETAIQKSGKTLFEVADAFGSTISIHGVVALSQGSLITSMIYAATLVHILDRQFMRGAYWMGCACLLSTVGLIHAYTLTPNGVETHLGWWRAPEFTWTYLAITLVLAGMHMLMKYRGEDPNALRPAIR